ncbi:MAG: cryptochrome/photolyase family protein [Maricaulaceae bacterium]
MSSAPVIVWFRRDLRVKDNPALSEAVKTGQPIIALYIREPHTAAEQNDASEWWLHHSLSSLRASLNDIGLPLTIMPGEAGQILENLIETTDADHVFWNRRYAETGREIDTAIKASLKDGGITAKSYKANLLTEPWETQTKTGGYYKVFTPYWKNTLINLDPRAPIPAPTSAQPYAGKIESFSIEDLSLLPTRPDWGSKMAEFWTIGEAGAQDALDIFLSGHHTDYQESRNRPDMRHGTSRLSPHLAFGEISPYQIWHACEDRGTVNRVFLSEVGWREFSYVLLHFNPKLASENYKPAFDAFKWAPDDGALTAWQRGRTGYPFVDAGMRQLWDTGWQHNRVRMVTASFLIKHLLIDWREGEKWFKDTLLDYDPASNAASWQWVAGSGADASPYFRIFNPFTQGEKFDPEGTYVRRFVPELANMPKKYIHRPWEAPTHILAQAGVKLGETYPRPIVDHKAARERAMAAYNASKSQA